MSINTNAGEVARPNLKHSTAKAFKVEVTIVLFLTYKKRFNYNNQIMKTGRLLGIISFLLIALITLLTISNFDLSAKAAQSGTAALALQQATPTSINSDSDGSEIGSTNGIFIMGIVITLIVTLPLLLSKRKLM